MSAFYVGHQTMNDVCQLVAIKSHGEANHERLTKLGIALLTMNADALSQRYPDSWLEMVGDDELPHMFRFDGSVLATEAQRAKSAQCLRYQCAEGNVPDLPLYKRLNALCEAVGEPDGYHAAQWGR
ncbi:hypothetical protein [uncultured Maritimibacter sp.]|uniref:hypothetical protein n=1 Tax=uncultured Maritimibacter sp. TaxID=991866 RepID=UPI002596B85B|nr:hypothetical protein [uncultured Maritimibacter sp.]